MRNALLVLLAVGIIGYLLFSGTKQYLVKEPEEILKKCNILEQTKTVQGFSMEPFIQNGEDIIILENYYECNPIQRNDVVAYVYGGNKNPIIKFIKGVPGDSFSLEKTNNDSWHIMIAGKPAVNSENMPYALPVHKTKMLSLYIKSYNGVIPEGAYLLLGDVPGGTQDSTVFGLVGGNDIIGKVKPLLH